MSNKHDNGREEDYGTRCEYCDKRSMVSPCNDCRKPLDTADCCETLDEARGVIRRLEAKVESMREMFKLTRDALKDRDGGNNSEAA